MHMMTNILLGLILLSNFLIIGTTPAQNQLDDVLHELRRIRFGLWLKGKEK